MTDETPVTTRLRPPRSAWFIGALIVVYLAAMIAFAYIGQTRLRSALEEQQHLNAEKQAASFAFMIADLERETGDLANSPTIRSYLANRDLGMSLRYGLRASLQLVERQFEAFSEALQRRSNAIVTHVRLLEPDGQVVASYHAERYGPALPAGAEPMAGKPRTLRVDGQVLLAFDAVAEFKGEPRGWLTVAIDAPASLDPLVHVTGGALGAQIAVVDGDGSVLLTSPRFPQHGAQGNGRGLLQVPVGRTGLRVMSQPDASLHNGFITSPWFLGALAAFSLPLLLGVLHVVRINNHNLVLRTRYHATTQQRMLLREQNERLQREVDRRIASEEQLAHQANYDQLTGLPNRNLATDRLAQALKWARREDGRVLLMFLDLDRFKQVNDSLGHAAGDQMLREAAQRLQQSLRDRDTVSRLGGDEFLVICPDLPEPQDWEHCAKNLLHSLARPFTIGGHEFYVGASIGVAIYPEGGQDPHSLLKNADIAMYAAKERGRNRYCLYDPGMDIATVERLQLENNLRHALERDEFHLLFQPIVSLSSGQTVAVEALLRWHNPQFGSIPPDRFIPIAEETGLIHEIGEWVLYQACMQIASIDPGHRFRLAINLSSKQFGRAKRLLDAVLRALRHSGLMPAQLELEITESLLIDDHPDVATLLNQLDRIGVRLSIDDFGTGYSALNYLQRFPFDVLKIDRSFTALAPENPANASLIRAIIAMAHALDLEVIAEGIEKREQAGFLLVQHCEYGQGHLYDRPLTLDQLHARLLPEAALDG